MDRGYDEMYEPIEEVAERQLCDGALVKLDDGAEAVVISDLGGIRRREILVEFVSGGCDNRNVRCGTQALITVSRHHVRVQVLKAP
jgi:hypothetical protein